MVIFFGLLWAVSNVYAARPAVVLFDSVTSLPAPKRDKFKPVATFETGDTVQVLDQISKEVPGSPDQVVWYQVEVDSRPAWIEADKLFVFERPDFQQRFLNTTLSFDQHLARFSIDPNSIDQQKRAILNSFDFYWRAANNPRAKGLAARQILYRSDKPEDIVRAWGKLIFDPDVSVQRTISSLFNYRTMYGPGPGILDVPAVYPTLTQIFSAPSLDALILMDMEMVLERSTHPKKRELMSKAAAMGSEPAKKYLQQMSGVAVELNDPNVQTYLDEIAKDKDVDTRGQYLGFMFMYQEDGRVRKRLEEVARDGSDDPRIRLQALGLLLAGFGRFEVEDSNLRRIVKDLYVKSDAGFRRQLGAMSGGGQGGYMPRGHVPGDYLLLEAAANDSNPEPFEAAMRALEGTAASNPSLMPQILRGWPIDDFRGVVRKERAERLRAFWQKWAKP